MNVYTLADEVTVLRRQLRSVCVAAYRLMMARESDMPVYRADLVAAIEEAVGGGLDGGPDADVLSEERIS